jgi:GTP-binding protein HflX
LSDGRAAVIADTVGFVRRLPHHLVEAFRSTLAESSEADLLVHVVDGTDQDPTGQIDAISEAERARLSNLWPDAVLISAREAVGLQRLLDTVTDALAKGLVTLSLSVPYDRGDVVAAAHRLGEVVAEKHDVDGTILDVRLPESATARFADFLIVS